MMHSHTCNCLNVRLDVAQLLAEPPASLSEPVRREPLVAAGCLWALLGPGGAAVEQTALLQRQPVAGAPEWSVCRCLNCGCVTHATCETPGTPAAVSPYLLSEPARIAALLQSERYSAAFRIVLPELTNALERSLAPPASPRSHPALTAALRHMKLNLTAYVKREEKRVETAIQNFRDEKLAELKETKQRAYDDSQAFTNLLVRVEDQLRVTMNPATSTGASSGTNAVSSVESEGRDTVAPLRNERRPCGVPVQDRVGMFLMDGEEDVEVAEEADEHYPQQLDDEGPDTDDSGVEEPRPLSIPSRAEHTTDMAHSLPVHIPLPPALLAMGRQRPGESDEEAVPDIDQMADSIRQLAQSYHTEPGTFADLPRPRTNTMNR